MLTKDDIQIIRNIVNEAVAPLVTRKEFKKELKETELRLKNAIKREHKYQGEVLNYCEKEDRRINDRVDKIQKFVGMPAVC